MIDREALLDELARVYAEAAVDALLRDLDGEANPQEQVETEQAA